MNDVIAALILAGRVVANPIANVLQKQLAQRSADPLFIIAATHGLLTLACAPLLIGLSPRVLPLGFWGEIATAALLAVAGNALLVAALRSSDLSVLGPINAYKAVVSLVPGALLIGEIPTWLGAIGIVLIVAGSFIVVDRNGETPRAAPLQFFRERGIQLRLAALVLSAVEAVFLKRALLLSTPLTTFVWWSVLGLPIAGAAVSAGRGWPGGLRSVRSDARTYVWLAIATGIMQLTTLLLFGRVQVGYALALFQLSTPMTVLLGHHYFQERNIRRRLAGSTVMALGAMLIVLFGRT